LWHNHFPCCDTHKPTAVLRHTQTYRNVATHTNLPQCCDTHKPTAMLRHNQLARCDTHELIKKHVVFSTVSFLGTLRGRVTGNILAFLLRILHGCFHLPMKTPGIRADARPVVAPGRLIMRRPFEPIYFNRFRPKTGLVNIFEGAFSNCG
jgi:hypothetical protein